MNIKSKLLNKSHLAKLAGLTPSELHNKLSPSTRNKELTDSEAEKLEKIIINELRLKQ
jgi:hypothetical protein